MAVYRGQSIIYNLYNTCVKCVLYVVKKVTSLGVMYNERAITFINLHDMYQLDKIFDKIRYIYVPLLNYHCVNKLLNSTDMMVDDRPLKGNLLLPIISTCNNN